MKKVIISGVILTAMLTGCDGQVAQVSRVSPTTTSIQSPDGMSTSAILGTIPTTTSTTVVIPTTTTSTTSTTIKEKPTTTTSSTPQRHTIAPLGPDHAEQKAEANKCRTVTFEDGSSARITGTGANWKKC